jgi:hypothetical protein
VSIPSELLGPICSIRSEQEGSASLITCDKLKLLVYEPIHSSSAADARRLLIQDRLAVYRVCWDDFSLAMSSREALELERLLQGRLLLPDPQKVMYRADSECLALAVCYAGHADVLWCNSEQCGFLIVFGNDTQAREVVRRLVIEGIP